MRKEKEMKSAILEYDDVLWLIQECTCYERHLAYGTVTAETGRRFMKSIINRFKQHL